MIAVVQRVVEASVVSSQEVLGEIGHGLAVLVAVTPKDGPADVQWMARKLSTMRLFPAGEKQFDLDVSQAGGSILFVSNFTVAGETSHGRRPSFDGAARPEMALVLFDELVAAVRATCVPVATGRFGADMLVMIANDGPVTVIIDSAARK